MILVVWLWTKYTTKSPLSSLIWSLQDQPDHTCCMLGACMECALCKCMTCTVLLLVVLRNSLEAQKFRSESYLIASLSDIVPDPISNMLIQLCDIFFILFPAFNYFGK